jgi:hypothetical protein
MSAATDLLTKLRYRGLTIEADGDALTVQPRDLLTDELRAEIRAHKRDLLAELPRYRWRIIGAATNVKEVCCLPEMTAAELQACYPGARIRALPDQLPD